MKSNVGSWRKLKDFGWGALKKVLIYKCPKNRALSGPDSLQQAKGIENVALGKVIRLE